MFIQRTQDISFIYAACEHSLILCPNSLTNAPQSSYFMTRLMNWTQQACSTARILGNGLELFFSRNKSRLLMNPSSLRVRMWLDPGDARKANAIKCCMLFRHYLAQTPWFVCALLSFKISCERHSALSKFCNQIHHSAFNFVDECMRRRHKIRISQDIMVPDSWTLGQ